MMRFTQCVPGIPRQGGQAAASIHFSDGGGGVKLEKCQIFRRASRAKSQYLTFRAKRPRKNEHCVCLVVSLC